MQGLYPGGELRYPPVMAGAERNVRHRARFIVQILRLHKRAHCKPSQRLRLLKDGNGNEDKGIEKSGPRHCSEVEDLI